MRTIVISIQPQWVDKILNGKKTVEIRKTKPSCELTVKVYIYCSWGDLKTNYMLGKRGKVVAEFALNKVSQFDYEGLRFFDMKDQLLKSSCLTDTELCNYIQDKTGYAWHIDDLKIYDEPKEITKFRSTSFCFNMANVDIVKNCLGEYVDKCYENSFCKICKHIDDFGTCGKRGKILTRPPQSWCYVEELEAENG